MAFWQKIEVLSMIDFTKENKGSSNNRNTKITICTKFRMKHHFNNEKFSPKQKRNNTSTRIGKKENIKDITQNA